MHFNIKTSGCVFGCSLAGNKNWASANKMVTKLKKGENLRFFFVSELKVVISDMHNNVKILG